MSARLTLVILAAFLALVPRAASPAEAPALPGVLVIFSDERVIPANLEFETALRDALGLPRADIEYSAEFLDSTRFSGSDIDAAWRDFLKRKYAGHDIRVVVAAGTSALDFIDTYHQELFPGVPVIVSAVSANLMGGRRLPPDFISLAFEYDLAGTIQMARQLQPGAKEIVVAVGTTDADVAWESLVQRDLPPVGGGLRLRILRNLSLEDILKEVAALTPASIGLYVPINQDGAGRTRIPRETLAAIEAVSGAPYYSVFSTVIGSGVVGGHVTTYAHMGGWTAGIIKQILGGIAPARIPIPGVPSSLVVDWRAMERWGLDASRLPAGTDIRFREATIWQQYRWQIVGVVALIALQTFLIASLVIQRHRRAAAEARSHADRNDLAHLTRVGMIGELSSSLAHELNQPLTAILSNAQAAQQFLKAPEPDLSMVREIVDDIVADDRRAGEVIARLRVLMKKGPPQVQPLRLDEVVRDVFVLMRHDLERHAVTVSAEYAADLPAVAGDRIQLQQVVLNLLMNAADAVRDCAPAERLVTVRAARSGNAAYVTVHDRGHGLLEGWHERAFQPFFTTKADGLGMGLAISRTIVEEHHGRIWAQNHPGGGATFHLELPGLT